MRRTIKGVLGVAMLVTLAAGCGSSNDGDTAGQAATSTAAPASTAAPSTVVASTTTTQSTTGADCGNAALLQAAQEAISASGSTVTITSVTVTRCRNGYALVSAHPSGGGDSPNVFLVWRPAAGTWQAIDVGTGIDCAGSPIGPVLTAACKALGY
jgi:hypothetical protein